MIHANEIALGQRAPTADECRAQVDRIQQSADFGAPERERRIFAYIAEEALSGRGERIKAYSIAVEVLGRDQSFDPQNDPIVRVEAGRLRRALERYYSWAGNVDPIVIEIPKGCYVPEFSWRKFAPGNGATPVSANTENNVDREGRRNPRWLYFAAGLLTMLVCVTGLFLLWTQSRSSPSSPEIPHILVSPFDDLTKSDDSAAIATGLTHEVVDQLSKFKDVIVQSSELNAGSPGPGSHFRLDGSVEMSADEFRLRVRFINRDGGSVLWAKSYDGAMRPSDLVNAQTDIARDVATTLAQSYGIIFQSDLTRTVSDPPDDWAAYSCTLSYYAYRINTDRQALPAVRNCLESAVERFPNYATAWALLAQVLLDEARFTFPSNPSSTTAAAERALSTARHAVELEPLNVRGLQAEMLALFFTRQYDAGRKVGEKALGLNPNDTELMGEYGFRLALSGDWTRGCNLMARGRQHNPGPPGYYETGLALCSFFKNDPKTAVMWLKQATRPTNPIYHLIAAGVFSEAGLKADAERELMWLCKNQRTLIEDVRATMSARLGRAQDVEFWLGALKKAGWTDGTARQQMCN